MRVWALGIWVISTRLSCLSGIGVFQSSEVSRTKFEELERRGDGALVKLERVMG